VIQAHSGWRLVDLAELWRHREVIGFLALRDLKARYKQSVLGVSWAILQPLLTMVVFATLFSALMGARGLPTLEGVPYAVSTFCALVPWQLFATSLRTSGNSLVVNQNLITKVYFPRLAAPIAPVLATLVDFALAFGVLALMIAAAGIVPGVEVLALPAFTLLAVLAALAAALWLSAINALYRDVQHALPFLVQLWMFATPVVYTSDHVLPGAPGWVASLYGLNPMVAVVEGFRWSLLGGPAPNPTGLAGAVAVVGIALVGGAFFFRRLEREFADRV
jgi:lipopolysaccharide transport system permease protein